jgi:hypothetical protein
MSRSGAVYWVMMCEPSSDTHATLNHRDFTDEMFRHHP